MVLVWCVLTLPACARTKVGSDRQGGVEVCQVQLFPDVPMNEVRVEVVVRVPKAGKYTLTCERSCYPDEDPDLATHQETVRLQKGENTVSVLIDMGENPHLWSEFHPDLYRFRVALASKKGLGEATETLSMRQWEQDEYAPEAPYGSPWRLNGLGEMLRPLVPQQLDVPVPVPDAPSADWLRFFQHAREKGFNHMHQTLEAATPSMLAAADTAGFYLHIDEPDTPYRIAGHPSIMPYMPHADTLLYTAPLAFMVELGTIYLSTDTLKGDILLANYTEDDHRQPVRWTFQSIDAAGQPDGHLSTDGEEDYVDAWQGEVTRVTTLNVPLSGIQAPQRLRLTVSTEGATLLHDIDIRQP